MAEKAQAATTAAADDLQSSRGPAAEEKDIFSYSKRVVVVKGMPEDVTEDDVRGFVGEDAGVENIKIRLLRRRQQPLVGVKFVDQESAASAIEKLNGTSFKDNEVTCEPKRMLKRSARRKRAKMIVSFDPVTIVVRVENETADSVKDMVAKYGKVEEFTAKESGITYIVKFETAEQAEAALSAEDVKMGENEVRMRKYRVRTRAPAEPKAEPAQASDKKDKKDKPKKKKKAKKTSTKTEEGEAAASEAPKKQRKERKPRPNKRLFVAGFPVDTDPNDILDLMEGSIRATVRNQTAFVNFSEAEDAQAAIDKFSGQTALNSDQPLRVEFKRYGRRYRGGRRGNGAPAATTA